MAIGVFAFVIALAGAGTAAASGASVPAPAWSPMRIAIDCQSTARAAACAFVRGFVDATPLLAATPRGDAQVIAYLNATERANDDLIQLRFVATIAGAPAVYEVSQAVDSRASDDEQRAQLAPAFRRGVAVFLGVINPGAVSVELTVPAEAKRLAPPTTPWGVTLAGGGSGSWSRGFQRFDGWASLTLSRTTARSRLSAEVAVSYGESRQPPLVIDGEEIALDRRSYDQTGQITVERHLDDAWSVGAVARGGRQDPDGQYEATARAHAGLSRDWYPSDDPRGNRLALAYLAGAQADWYRRVDVLGERAAWFPTHMLLASGSVRKDTTTYGAYVSATAELLQPTRRHVLRAQLSVSIAVGAHVDLSLSCAVTRQAIPGPAAIDTGSVAAVSRASYAEPLSVSGFASLTIHWDATNGARNNRFAIAEQLYALANL